MKGYLGMILREHHLWDVLPVKPMFISAQDSWEWQRSGRIGQSPLAVLEEAIWTHLLSTNSTGLDRLIAAVTELRRAGSDFASLLETRRMSGGEAFSLRKSLDACRAREQELVTACHERAKIDEAFVRHRLTTSCVALLRRLQEQLEKVPLNQQLPPASHIEKEFQTQIMQLLTDVWKESSARFQNFASYVSQEVEKSLQQVRLTTGAHDQVQFLLPQVPALNVAEDSFEEAWTGLFTGGLVGLLIWGPWGLALAAGGWLAGVFLGRERRRKRELARIIERAQASLTAALDTVFVQFGEKIRIFFRSLERHVTDRISVFIHDIEGQLQKLDTPVPPEEQRRLADHEKAVRATLETLADVCGQLGLESRRDA